MPYNNDTRDIFLRQAIAQAAEQTRLVQNPEFQCCVGPSQNRAHIRELKSQSPLTLCESTAPARDYKASVPVNMICQRCLRVMFDRLGHTNLTPELIGVPDITT